MTTLVAGPCGPVRYGQLSYVHAEDYSEGSLEAHHGRHKRSVKNIFLVGETLAWYMFPRIGNNQRRPLWMQVHGGDESGKDEEDLADK